VTLRIWQSKPCEVAYMMGDPCTGCALQALNTETTSCETRRKQLGYDCMPHSGYTILKEIKPKA